MKRVPLTTILNYHAHLLKYFMKSLWNNLNRIQGND